MAAINIPPPPSALQEANEYMRASWTLGFHDGLNEISPSAGEAVLQALTVGVWDHASRLGVVKAKEDRLLREQERATADLIPTFGNHPIGKGPWIVIAAYFLFGIFAFVPEFFLNANTVGQAGAIASGDFLEQLQNYTLPALALIITLLSCSLKLVSDALDMCRKRAWRPVAILLLTCFCFAVAAKAAWNIAELRGMVAIQESMTYAAKSTNGDSDNPTTTANLATAAQNVANGAGTAFSWLTKAMFLFSATCFIVALHQLRDYSKHKRALQNLDAIDEELPGITDERATLESAVETERKYKTSVSGDANGLSMVDKRAVFMYRHGFDAGRATLLEHHGQDRLYARLLVKLNKGIARCPDFL